MNVIACNKKPSAAVAEKLMEKGIRLTTFAEVIGTSDFISLHVPLDESTKNLINREVLREVKPSAILVNISRGGVVDEVALHEALSENRLRGAGVDVHEREGEGELSPLADCKNVILTPHIGAMSYDSQKEIGQRVIDACAEFASNDLSK
jgi:phosphoglycerate dehydrogenase-like enzyme